MTAARRAGVLAMLLTLACASHALAQAAPSLTNIAGLRSLGREALGRKPSVRISGIFTAREPGGDGYLQDQGMGLRIASNGIPSHLSPGTSVDVDGVADLDDRGIVVHPARVLPTGVTALPDPRPISLRSIAQPSVHGLRVMVEGIVVATSPVERRSPSDPPELIVVLGSPEGTLGLRVTGRAHDTATAALRGSRIRSTGVVQPVASPQGQLINVMLLVAATDPQGIVQADAAPPRDPSIVHVENLLRAGYAAGATHPIRIQGVVTAVLSPLSVFLQDATGGILVRIPPSPTQTKPGDVLTAEGSPRVEMIVSTARNLETTPVVFQAYAARLSPRQPLPAAVPVSHDALRQSKLNFRRITLEGRVQAVVREGSSRDFRLSLDCGDTTVDVVGRKPSLAPPLPLPQSRVRVTGVLDQRAQVDTQHQPLRIHLAHSRDLVEIAPPPRDPTRILTLGVLLATVLGLGALAWALALRRGVRLRTAELATANATLAQANQSLALASRARADFLAHMSHEVRTPVHAMNGLLQLLARHPLPHEPQAIVQRLAVAGRSLTHVVNDALDLSKIDAGQLDLDPQPFHPNALLDHLDGLFAPLAQDKGLAWSVQRLPVPTPQLVGDSLRIQQVLSNLASNAIKFTRHGHVRLLASLAPASPFVPNGPQIFSITCEDSGAGIAPDALQRLFQPYSQADASIQRTHGGTGLGLAIARRLADLMGGSLHAESQPGVGSRFRLLVSLAVHAGGPTQDPPAQDPSPGFLPHGQRLEGRRILVADDHPTNLGILEMAIEQEHGCAWLVPDGLAALQAFESDPAGFDAVIMDLEMPVMDGLESIRRIRAQSPGKEVPILACSAGIRPTRRQAALEAGATGFLPKPFDLGDLVSFLVRHGKPRPMGATATSPTPRPNTVMDLSSAASPTPHPFPSIHGIDADDAAQRFAGNRDHFLRALGRFHAAFNGFAVVLEGHVRCGARESITQGLHGLTGTAAMLGARRLASMADDLGQPLRRDPGAPGPAWDSFSPLVRELEQLLASIQSHLVLSECQSLSNARDGHVLGKTPATPPSSGKAQA